MLSVTAERWPTVTVGGLAVTGTPTKSDDPVPSRRIFCETVYVSNENCASSQMYGRFTYNHHRGTVSQVERAQGALVTPATIQCPMKSTSKAEAHVRPAHTAK